MNEEIITREDEVVATEDVVSEEVVTETVTEADDTQDELSAPEEETPLKETSEAELLRAELEALRTELEEKKKVFERMSREIGEFSEIFPERSVNTIPDSVWESVKAGIPLAAAYALYERKNAVRADAASRINERNGEKSTGAIGRTSTENFYTPDEVRAMSRSEVRKNYSKIIESMKKWN